MSGMDIKMSEDGQMREILLSSSKVLNEYLTQVYLLKVKSGTSLIPLTGGLYALRVNSRTFRKYTDTVFYRFFRRDLNIEDMNELLPVLKDSLLESPLNREQWANAFTTKETQDQLDQELEEIRQSGAKDKISKLCPNVVVCSNYSFALPRQIKEL